ncbi:M55 family metallopeptidase [candidate division CSSED10-310 bacterium]|uniref:M55 family metallopeptidase n=1 Tax=candidate division CSSED10-310 bacterium TaxID=2855610 RepID=A0ABV6Z3C3_UNCC1
MSKQKDLKIYISADIEGITGVVAWDETEEGKPDFNYFRKVMAQEVNAGIEAAFDKGAQEVVVRDAHGHARNILPSELHRKAKLIRSWSNGPLGMMEGIDRDYNAVMFIGYHAKAGTPNSPLKHTYSGQIFDLCVNDVSLPEAGWNALIAGYYKIPLIFASGDKALCTQVKSLIDTVITVPVKEGIGKACLTLHPEEAQALIKKGVSEAVDKFDQMKPFTLTAPYLLKITFSDESVAWRAKWYPGAQLKNERTLFFESKDFFDLLRFFHFVVA